MNAAKYVSILSDSLISSAAQLNMSNLIFQQSNDLKHTSKLAKSFLEENDIRVLSWPPQSPNMNPIESIWSIIKNRVADLQPKNKVDRKQAIITPEITRNLVNSFKKS